MSIFSGAGQPCSSWEIVYIGDEIQHSSPSFEMLFQLFSSRAGELRAAYRSRAA